MFLCEELDFQIQFATVSWACWPFALWPGLGSLWTCQNDFATLPPCTRDQAVCAPCLISACLRASSSMLPFLLPFSLNSSPVPASIYFIFSQTYKWTCFVAGFIFKIILQLFLEDPLHFTLCCRYVCFECMLCVPYVHGTMAARRGHCIRCLELSSGCGWWELHLGPLQEHQELLTAEPFSSPSDEDEFMWLQHSCEVGLIVALCYPIEKMRLSDLLGSGRAIIQIQAVWLRILCRVIVW